MTTISPSAAAPPSLRPSTSMSGYSHTDTFRSARQSIDARSWTDDDATSAISDATVPTPRPAPPLGHGQEDEVSSASRRRDGAPRPPNRTQDVEMSHLGGDTTLGASPVMSERDAKDPSPSPSSKEHGDEHHPPASSASADPDLSRTPPPLQEELVPAPAPPPPQREPLRFRIARHAGILSLLAFASIWGTLAREGLVALNTYDGQSIAPLIWAQSVGCLVMGWSIGNRKALEAWSPSIYLMVTTGFCGSVTTFSSWILEVFRAFGDQRHFARGGLHNVMDALTQTGATLGMSLISLYAGKRLANLLDVSLLARWHAARRGRSAALSGDTGGRSSSSGIKAHVTDDEDHHLDAKGEEANRELRLNLFFIVFGLAFWIGAALLCALKASFGSVTFSLVLAPPGTFLRWYLSRLNLASISTRRSFPLGTFGANILATLVISSSFTSQRFGRAAAAAAAAAGGGGSTSSLRTVSHRLRHASNGAEAHGSQIDQRSHLGH
ncbi:uncharacterized protein PSFLO_04983 [Pseudozyma flocculosa]|uniref:Fluoride ion transporter CrcB n=1 Tax=Pseudozyma flocculosa TaxID=84751 RepID=A0A5C3F564_9BASI|nr:uncharacterized protein PSFLO_04983 [Pseudozyma flocculosa]